MMKGSVCIGERTRFVNLACVNELFNLHRVSPLQCGAHGKVDTIVPIFGPMKGSFWTCAMEVIRCGYAEYHSASRSTQ